MSCIFIRLETYYRMQSMSDTNYILLLLQHDQNVQAMWGWGTGVGQTGRGEINVNYTYVQTVFSD